MHEKKMTSRLPPSPFGVSLQPGLLAAAALFYSEAGPIWGADYDQNPSADKSSYHLFRPTPPSLMRELSADRPDKTDCPFTVDAGHFQVEMDLANLTYNRSRSSGGNLRLVGYEVAPLN